MTGPAQINDVYDPQHAHAEHEHEHPSDWIYIKVAIFLAIVTAVEVGLYYVDMSTSLLIATLIPLMVVKFAGVVWYFMHLKFDSNTFTRIFAFGLILAVTVYMVTLASFQFFA